MTTPIKLSELCAARATMASGPFAVSNQGNSCWITAASGYVADCDCAVVDRAKNTAGIVATLNAAT